MSKSQHKRIAVQTGVSDLNDAELAAATDCAAGRVSTMNAGRITDWDAFNAASARLRVLDAECQKRGIEWRAGSYLL